MKKCLIVDDSAVVRKLARMMIEGMGFACGEAADGKEALETCRTAMPALVLLDWNMPVMNGIDFMRALRAMPEGDTVKIVFCTTENNMPAIETALDAGADEYIMKPFDADILQSKFRQVGLI
ncbi:MAG TPA: response regulator [Alphaproteobacteria bacterium]|nr:two-component system response regulator [Rhodospirillaceae bacterium]HRJ67757.1 response regulator [Alphaproteobacteria bacterium]